MIPTAEHIARCRKSDDMCVREVDLSVRVENGWFSCGRYRTMSDEEDTRQGFWVCLATEHESEWNMDLSIGSTHQHIPQMVVTVLGSDFGFDDEESDIPSHIFDSINFLLYGTNDSDVIHKLRIEDTEKIPITEVLYDDPYSEES